MSDLHHLMREAAELADQTKRLAPPTSVPEGSFIQRVVGSYREFLSAFGRQCDQMEATTLLVMELSDAVLVSYQKTVSTYEAWDSRTFEFLYNEQGVRRLVLGSAFALKR
ncbi:MAG TPA: hypothetical protein VHB98_02690 [Chloroflexota bacterium]|nr:hypothetical protein [Chloroflexota bacterium]